MPSLPMCVGVILSAPYMANGKKGNERDVNIAKDHNEISRRKFGERESGAPPIHSPVPLFLDNHYHDYDLDSIQPSPQSRFSALA